MTGQILIIDALSNRRIQLQALLDTACYDVHQAESQLAGLSKIKSDAPDVVIIAHDLPGLNLRQFCKTLRLNPKTQLTTVMVAVPRENHSARISALSAGAADVVEYNLETNDLRARLRNFMRLRQTSEDTRIPMSPNTALGFSEEQRQFENPVQVTALGGTGCAVAGILERTSRLNVRMASNADMRRSPDPETDVFVLIETSDSPDCRDLIGALKTNTSSRHAAILYVTAQHRPTAGPSPLDLGAHDHVSADVTEDELILRIQRLAQRKRVEDRARANLSTLGTQAYSDELTGLRNRRFADEYLIRKDRELAQAPGALALLMVDIDHFKNINDTHGHAAGDAILQNVATVLKSQLRDGDMVARYGGEEFLIALSKVDAHQARSVAERLRLGVSQHPTDIGGGTIVRVTVSVGLALSTRGFQKPTADLRRAADNALYRAKNKGRNQINEAIPDDFQGRPMRRSLPVSARLDKTA